MRTRFSCLFVALLATWSATALAADTAKPTAKTELAIDRAHTAVLVMDYQKDIVGMVPEKARSPLLDRASEAVKAARQAGLSIIYVVVRFR